MSDNTMRVMWCEKPDELELRHMPLPTLGEEDVLVKVAYTAICPWDVRAYSGLSSSVKFPRVLGHEVSGYVAKVGKKVKDFEIGQPVVPDMIIKCGTCRACLSGLENRCQRPTYLQFGGGYADYVCVPQRNIHTLQHGADMKAAAMMEPLACVTRGQDMLNLYPGKVELVVGAGPIGLMHMQVARAFGARVIVSDPIPHRLKKAFELGSDWVVNPVETDLAGKVSELTDGWGVDAAVVTVGSARLVEEMLPLLAPGAHVNIFAGIYPKDELHVDPNVIHYGEFVLTGSADSTPRDMNRALGFITSNIVNTSGLISHTFELEDLAKGFEAVKSRQGLKVMIRVNGEEQ